MTSGYLNLKLTKHTLPAWLLLLIFTPQLIVKTFHYHGEGSGFIVCSHGCEKDEASDSDHSDTCAICDFVISTFTEATSIVFESVLDYVPFTYTSIESAPVRPSLPWIALRGPPTI
ncbi:hypothetical protein [Porphyromonas sp.]|uniref:hypothetical protein n=1 Tax=Porphyromonas sp. TaxID=1924944 RepID=UPI0026DAD56D|nr:hypothetical protein [Porphyromonas sp.]MDO4771777.1 hypothetical protein [Porphyromonas sp.]